ncbi:serine hydrolase domain-containing protein [Catenulispora subtropica]|uniref:Beta-lactamase-related domain-containing protein n=1 Tax=Catenulispora subtropica TaxID=450798 RepID=A0ABN2R6A1_9ACTN
MTETVTTSPAEESTGSTLNPELTAHWQTRLAELVEQHGVGASLAILHRGEIVAEAAAGWAHKGAGIEATTDTVFQIGSISKVWTATVAMALVDDGVLHLDTPIVDVLPELKLADEELTRKVTLRHLLTHSSGIDGDVFTDTGRGDDNLEKYVQLLADEAVNHPLGATMSYCNSGFSLLGRVMEVVTGTQWDELMRQRLFRPLGLKQIGTLPEEALLHRAAMGHIGTPPAPAPAWGLIRNAGPAGLIHTTPREVLAFVKMHLDGGVAADGTRILAEATTAAMQEPQIDVPDKWFLATHWGLGWFLDEWDGTKVFGHDGGTLGQSAFLRVLPEHDLAICLLTNGGDAMALYRAVFNEIAGELAGVQMRAPLEPTPEPLPFDPADYVGVYERASTRLEVVERDGGLVMILTVSGIIATLAGLEPVEMELRTLQPGVFVTRRPELDAWLSVVFYELPDGTKYIHHGARATPKVA